MSLLHIITSTSNICLLQKHKAKGLTKNLGGGATLQRVLYFVFFFKNNYHTAALAVAKPWLQAGCLIGDQDWGTTGPTSVSHTLLVLALS